MAFRACLISSMIIRRFSAIAMAARFISATSSSVFTSGNSEDRSPAANPSSLSASAFSGPTIPLAILFPAFSDPAKPTPMIRRITIKITTRKTFSLASMAFPFVTLLSNRLVISAYTCWNTGSIWSPAICCACSRLAGSEAVPSSSICASIC